MTRAAADGSGPAAGTRVFGYTEAGGLARAGRRPHGHAVPAPGSGRLGRGLDPGCGRADRPLRPPPGRVIARADGEIVTGAAGGVGRLAIQLATLSGANVIAIVGTEPTRTAAVAELGLPRLRVEQGLAETGEQAHLILESVGGSSLSAAFARVAHGGAIVTYGRSSGEPGAVPPDWFFANATLHGLSFSRHHGGDATSPTGLETLGRLVAEGRLDTGIGLEGSWDEVDVAIDALRERQVQGKAVLRIVDG